MWQGETERERDGERERERERWRTLVEHFMLLWCLLNHTVTADEGELEGLRESCLVSSWRNDWDTISIV